MNIEERHVGDPITLRLSGQEFYMLRVGLKEVLNEIDDHDLQTITGLDRATFEAFSNELNAIWRTLDEAERWTFVPGA